MHILHGFWRFLRTTSFVFVLSSINFAFAADISIFNWTANIADGVVSGVARCGPKSGSTSTSAKSWVSSNWATQNGGCFCRVQGIEDVSDWNNLNDAGSYWYGSGTGFDGGFEECSQNCAATCAQKFESDTYYQESLCGGTCPVSGSTTQYTINYDMDGGTGCSNTTYTDSAIICTPTRDGYTFDGWMDNNTYEMYNGGETVSNINLDLVAFWTINNYTITYNLNGGTGCSNTTYTSSDTVTLCTPTRDGYEFDGWYDNAEFNGDAVSEIASGSTGNKEYWAKWSQPMEWDCTDGIVDKNADSWTTEIRQVGIDIPTAESLRSATGIVTRAGNDGSYILNYQDQAEYQTNLDRYLTGQEFYVTWGLTTIRAWAGCSANSWNIEKENYSTQTLTFTNAGCGCSIDKQNWIVKKNLLTQNGSTWDEKNEYCRANCPAACADAVANDYAFRTALFNGQCPAPYVEQITCEPGYYIDKTQCSACPTGFTSDGEYAESIDDCYKISAINCSDANPYQPEHASDIVYGNSVNGKASCKTYYGSEDCILDDENACVITGLTCENGYVLRGNELIGINQDIDATNYTVSDYNWTAEFDYGTINGESMCSNTTPYYGVGYDATQTDYEQCFCRIASYTKTNGEQTNIDSRWANFGFIGNYIPATPDMTVIKDGQEVVIPGMQETYISRCSTRCPDLCASAFAKNSSSTTMGNGIYTNARNTLFNSASMLKCENFECESGIWLHVGNNAHACLSAKKISNPAFVVEYDNKQHYLNMSSDNVPLNSDTNTKMKIYYHGNEYNIYDNSINN